MRNRVWRLPRDRTGRGTIRTSPNAAAAAGRQSVQSLYRAATKLPTDRADTTERRSGICGRVSCEPAPAAYRGQSESADGKHPSGPPPPPRQSRSPDAAVLFLFLLPVRLWLRVAAGVGRILVPHVAMFMKRKQASDATDFFQIPTGRVVESGARWCRRGQLGAFCAFHG